MQKARNRRGFTLVELLIVLVIMCILTGAFVFDQIARQKTNAKTCHSNLLQIDAAKVQWAMDNNKPADAVPDMDELCGHDSYIREEPICPSGGRYTPRAVNVDPTCSHASHKL